MEFLDGMTQILTPYMGSMFVIMGVFSRMSVFMFMVPVFGDRVISPRIRLGIAVMLTFLMLPSVLGSAVPVTQLKGALQLIATEAIFGLFLGLILRLMIFGLQIVGNIVSQSMSISQPLGEGIATEPNPTLSTFFMLAGVTLLVTMDFHIEAFSVIVRSYSVFPLGTLPDLNNFAHDLTMQATQMFRWSLSLAFPFVVLNFIYNLLLGFVNRAMPQLLVSFVGMPAIIGIGIGLMAVSVGTIMIVWIDLVLNQNASLMRFQ